MKIYAKQINPEFQESLLFEDGLFPENMVLYVFEGYTRIPQYKAV